MMFPSGKLEKAISNASSYREWRAAATACDVAAKADRWKLRDETRRYDYVSIRNRLDRLRTMRIAKDDAGLLFTLNEGIHGNMGGMGRSTLYKMARLGTKQLVVDYVEEIASSLEHLASRKTNSLSVEDKVEFFRRASHCYGRTALMLSGAGSLLYFHLGVVKALWEQDLLPSIISGASGGAFIAAMVGTHSHEELEKIFDPEFLDLEAEKDVGFFKMFSLLKSKPIPVEEVREIYDRLIPDLTFQEAFDLTGYNINISVAPVERHQTSRLLNAVTSPNVLIREAVYASCSVPGFYPAVTLAAKNSKGERQPYLPGRKWVDGSGSEDLPVKRLSRLYGVNHTIASQTNPLVLPFIGEHKEQEGIVDIIKSASLSSAKTWMLASVKLFRRPIESYSISSKIANACVSLVSQTYTGDIT